MKKVIICTVVTGSTIEEFLFNLKKIQITSEMVELRIDSIKNVTIADLIIIKNHTKKPAILTCPNNIFLLQEAYGLGFDFIDIEISDINNFHFSITNKTKVIISFHDFKKTPVLKEIENIKERMKRYGPDIMKFATMVNNENDNQTLFKFLLNKKADEKMIVIGMGNKGKMTRIIAPFLGSHLTYASTKYSQSAPGQIHIEQLRTVYQRILSI